MTPDKLIADLFRKAKKRAVYGIDHRGKGGRIHEPNAEQTDGWRVFLTELKWVCIEGEPWQRVEQKT